MSNPETDWAQEEAERILGLWNPRFALYRSQEPIHGQFEIDRLAAVIRSSEQRGYARGVEEAAKIADATTYEDASYSYRQLIADTAKQIATAIRALARTDAEENQ